MQKKKNILLIVFMTLELLACQTRSPYLQLENRYELSHQKNWVTIGGINHTDDADSSITVTNSQGSAVDTFGLFISQIWSGTACSGSALYTATTTAGGGFFNKINFSASEQMTVGANFLYNMVSNALFYGYYTNSPATSLLPGVNNSGGDSWCINIGVFGNNACHQGESCSVNNLVTVHSQSVISIPITCNDSNETCTATTAKNQMF